MARHCVFCNAPGTTKEHVWPNWAAQRMSAEGPVSHFLNVVQEGGPDADRTWPQKQFTLTVGAVCGNCNNGWMGSLEGRTKSFFEAALDGKSGFLDAALQGDLAAWALKTAMMVVAQQKPAQSAIPADEYAHLYAQSEPSSAVRVWMAAYTGTISTALAHTYAGDVTIGDENQQQGDIWGGTIVFGSALFHLLGSNLPDLLASAQMSAPGVRQVWPYEQTFTWEPTPGFDDKQLPGFMDWFLAGHVASQASRRARRLP